MSAAYADLISYVQHLAPTWRKTQHAGFAQLLAALLERPTLCLTELARAFPRPERSLHGRLKRLTRLLANPRLDELALVVRWLKLSYHFSAAAPTRADGRPVLPVLIDTTYFEPFAGLIASVPCGSRDLPIALTTDHRTTLDACFPPEAAWPRPHRPLLAPVHRHPRPAPAAAQVRRWPSQNRIEEQLWRLIAHLVSPAVRPVFVGDRGFARADLFRTLRPISVGSSAGSATTCGPPPPSGAPGSAATANATGGPTRPSSNWGTARHWEPSLPGPLACQPVGARRGPAAHARPDGGTSGRSRKTMPRPAWHEFCGGMAPRVMKPARSRVLLPSLDARPAVQRVGARKEGVCADHACLRYACWGSCC